MYLDPRTAVVAAQPANLGGLWDDLKKAGEYAVKVIRAVPSTQPQYPGYYSTQPYPYSSAGGSSVMPILLIGGVAVLAVVLLTRPRGRGRR